MNGDTRYVQGKGWTSLQHTGLTRVGFWGFFVSQYHAFKFGFAIMLKYTGASCTNVLLFMACL